jgi:hypothetical protein
MDSDDYDCDSIEKLEHNNYTIKIAPTYKFQNSR